MFAQIPAPPPGTLEPWLLCAAAVMAMVVMGKKLFVRKPPIEAEFASKADCLTRHNDLRKELDRLWDTQRTEMEKLREQFAETVSALAANIERSRKELDSSIADLNAAIARLDERSKL